MYDYNINDVLQHKAIEIAEALTEDTLIQDRLIDITERLWYSFLKQKPVSTLNLIERIGMDTESIMLFNKFIVRLSKENWIISTVNSNFATIELNKEEVEKRIKEEKG